VSTVILAVREELEGGQTATVSRLLICALEMAEKTKSAALMGILDCILAGSYQGMW